MNNAFAAEKAKMSYNYAPCFSCCLTLWRIVNNL
ncbi:hypothetical protein F994_00767 [Acinetobacter bohemicus ANC 3994]|uniref:Uncharacterized protein n=1 Tax=Acinetobacter bohemicus ANC 3994 TaxID=1217715 RepID=N8P1T0_9GAMM|nr:hypothetical protein F994_00767 [Acinetobacter bohemicus ANC 3994]